MRRVAMRPSASVAARAFEAVPSPVVDDAVVTIEEEEVFDPSKGRHRPDMDAELLLRGKSLFDRHEPRLAPLYVALRVNGARTKRRRRLLNCSGRAKARVDVDDGALVLG